ncbi:MAG: tetratricopeptide repeat protein [Planctomycetes bacterium]|jgi:tetratricopeptide (TPR) repeat protein|nr:tetratricopeptide repeat protein [Planctomycetota bacterium]MCL4730190.1 tetratricopeptide repeat protein [Planctomycetota bacterium]
MADVSKFLAKADDALKKRNYDYAIQMYESAMMADPGNADARRNFRVALVKKYDEIGYPKTFGFGAVKTMMVSKDPAKLLEETEKLVAKDPKNLKYNRRVAEVLMTLNHQDAAVAVLEFAVKNGDVASEKDAATLQLLAKAYIKVGKVQEAQACLNRALKIAPNDKDVKQLSKDIAAQAYNKNVGVGTGTVKSSYDLVKDRGEADKLEKLRKGMLTEEDADTLLREEEEKLKQNPLDRRVVRTIAEILVKRRKYNEAADRLFAFVKVDPSATEIAEEGAKYRNMYFDAMIRLCQQKAQEEPQKAAAYQAKEQQIREQKKAFQLEEYGRMVEAAPTDLDKQFNYGKALFEAGRQQDAFKHFQKAVKSPKHAKQSGLMMAQCLVAMGRLEMAETQLSNVEGQLTDLDEELKKELMYTQADLLEKKGDMGAALDKFRGLFLEDMEFRDVEQRIDALKAATGSA